MDSPKSHQNVDNIDSNNSSGNTRDNLSSHLRPRKYDPTILNIPHTDLNTTSMYSSKEDTHHDSVMVDFGENLSSHSKTSKVSKISKTSKRRSNLGSRRHSQDFNDQSSYSSYYSNLSHRSNHSKGSKRSIYKDPTLSRALQEGPHAALWNPRYSGLSYTGVAEILIDGDSFKGVKPTELLASLEKEGLKRDQDVNIFHHQHQHHHQHHHHQHHIDHENLREETQRDDFEGNSLNKVLQKLPKDLDNFGQQVEKFDQKCQSDEKKIFGENFVLNFDQYSDEENQIDSGIPFSNTGHLKYPPSEHLRYEYIRNDLYHETTIPLFFMEKEERFNIVLEQEKLLQKMNQNEQNRSQVSFSYQNVDHVAPKTTPQFPNSIPNSIPKNIPNSIPKNNSSITSSTPFTSLPKSNPNIDSLSAILSVNNDEYDEYDDYKGDYRNNDRINTQTNQTNQIGPENIKTNPINSTPSTFQPTQIHPSPYPPNTLINPRTESILPPQSPTPSISPSQSSSMSCHQDHIRGVPCENCIAIAKAKLDSELIHYDDSQLAIPESLFDFPSRAELFAQLHLSIPLIFSFSACYTIELISLAFLGHLNEKSLAAGSMALFYQNLTGISLLSGLNTGIDTFGAQYYGSGQIRMVGMIGLRGALIGTIAYCLIAWAWWFSAGPLGLFGIEEDIAFLAQEYCRICILSLPAIQYLDVLRRILEVQQICIPSMIVNLFGMVLVFPLNSYFIHTLGLGFYGPAYVWVIVNWIMVFAQFAYFYGSGLNKICMPHKILSWSLFKGWIQYLRVALPAVGAVAAEWLAFEMQTIVASRLGSRALASQALVTSINALIFNVPLSNAVAVSCRLGAFLGARKPSAGLLAYKTALKIAWITQLITAGVLWIFAYEIVSLFTDVEAIKEMTVDVLPLLSLFCLVDGFQGMIQGVLRGFAAQSYAFVMNLFWFWIISLPLSIYLSLYVGTHQYGSTDQNGPVQGMGLVGIWISLLIGSSGILVSYLVYLGKTSWTQRTNFIYASLLEEEREQMLLASQKSELSDEEDGDGDSNTGDGDDYDGDSLTQNINSINNNSFGSMNNSNNPDRNNQCHETPLLDISNPLSGRSYGGLE